MASGSVSVRAQAPSASPTPALQVIQQQVINAGTHRIIFNRVAPPPPQPVPAPAVPAAPAASANRPGGLQLDISSAAAADADGNGEEEDYHLLFLSATVYDGQFTELHGSDAQGGSWRAWSNVDFRLLAGVGEFATPTATYSLYLGLGTDTVDSLSQTGLYPTNLASLPAGQAAYYFANGATAATHPEASAALNALHAYHDAYRPQLLQAHQEHQAYLAAHAAQAEWERLHPTPPPDTIINFWPKQNSSYLGR